MEVRLPAKRGFLFSEKDWGNKWEVTGPSKEGVLWAPFLQALEQRGTEHSSVVMT